MPEQSDEEEPSVLQQELLADLADVYQTSQRPDVKRAKKRETASSLPAFHRFWSLRIDLLVTSYKDLICNVSSAVCRWRPAHAGEAEDEDHEPLPADAECGAAQRQSPEGPGGGGAAGGGGQGAGQNREETVERAEQT